MAGYWRALIAVRRLVNSGGDVFVKGANALNYDRRVAGVTAISPSGGTVGGCWGFVLEKKATLVIPMGLVKLVAQDAHEMARVIGRGMSKPTRFCLSSRSPGSS